MTNPDRTIILDLSAIEEARGPQPNDYFVCVTPREAVTLAAALAYHADKENCGLSDCGLCNKSNRLFWDLLNEVGPKLQAQLIEWLQLHSIALPGTPWEEAGE